MSKKEPQYLKVISYIEDEIRSGRLKQGSRMPSEKELCERFSLSRQTIRHATGELEKRGIITRVRGSGSYIGTPGVQESGPKHMNIAVMLTYVDSYIFPSVLRGISGVLEQAGYAIQISFTDNQADREATILKNLLENDAIDALIAEPSESTHPNPNRRYYERLRERHIPVLFIHESYAGLDMPCVRMDDQEIGYRAAKLLLDRGHREIGGIFQCELLQGTYRYMGFCRALREAGLPVLPERMIWLDTRAIRDAEELTGYLRKRLSGCTGVFTYNDEVASHLIHGCRGLGMSLPEDLSIVSVDDADLARNINPHLTTFPHPKEALGQKAAENILQMIKNPLFNGNYVFHPDPVIRDSLKQL